MSSYWLTLSVSVCLSLSLSLSLCVRRCVVALTAQLFFNSTVTLKNEHSFSHLAQPTDPSPAQ